MLGSLAASGSALAANERMRGCRRCLGSSVSQLPQRTPAPPEQVDRAEVRLRRSIGMKKDDYYLDRKHTTWVLLLPSC